MPDGRKNNRGTKGNKGGRKGYGLELKIGALKNTLIDAIIEDCANNPEKRLFWAEKFKDRLMPQELKGSGDDGEFVVKIVGGSYTI